MSNQNLRATYPIRLTALKVLQALVRRLLPE